MLPKCEAVWYCMVFWIILIQILGSSNASTYRCFRPCRIERNYNYCLNIACKRKHVLVHLNITSGNSFQACEERNYTSCFGLSLGLKANINECYWKSQCSVPFPMQKLVTSIDVMDPLKCRNEKPDLLQVFDSRCARKKEIIDMTASKILRLRKRNSQGIIRSHSQYPWDYSSKLFNNHVEHKIIFNLRGKYMQSRILLVNVRVLAICDTEELTFKTSRNTARVSSVNGPDRVCNIKTMDRDKRIGPINETHNMCNWEFERENERLEVRFRGSNETTGCEGFFLCYKVYRKRERPKTMVNVCDAVAGKKPNITPSGSFTGACLDRIGNTDRKKKKGKAKTEREKKYYCCCPGLPSAKCNEALNEMETFKSSHNVKDMCPESSR